MLDQGRGLSRDEKGNQAGEARCLAYLRAVSGRVGNVRGAMQVGRNRWGRVGRVQASFRFDRRARARPGAVQGREDPQPTDVPQHTGHSTFYAAKT
jgi:hypothetical protein